MCLQSNANCADLAKRLKHSESVNVDLQRRVDELTNDLSNANGDRDRLNAELTRLRVQVNDLTDKNDQLNRDNKQLSGTQTKQALLLSVSVRDFHVYSIVHSLLENLAPHYQSEVLLE